MINQLTVTIKSDNVIIFICMILNEHEDIY